MAVSVKTYLKFRSKSPEIRRFSLPEDASSSFLYLTEKIQRVYPSLLRKEFKLFWQDQDGELITFSSDEELMEALGNLKTDFLRVYIECKDQEASTEDDLGAKEEHIGVVCDVCDTGIKGTRYKCLICVDYDLCGICEGKGFHSEHEMIRIRKPRRGPFPGWWQAWGRCGGGRRGKCGRHKGCPWKANRGPRGPHFGPGSFPPPPPHGHPPPPPPPHGHPPPPPHGHPPFGCHRPFGMGHWFHMNAEENSDNKQQDGASTGNGNGQNVPEYFRALGNFLGTVLEPFGVDVETYADPTDGVDDNGSCCSHTSVNPEATDQKVQENSQSDPADEIFVDAEKTQEPVAEATAPSQDSDFVMVDNGNKEQKSASDEAQPTQPDDAPLTEEEIFQKRLNEAVAQMEAMGFKNEDGWLTQLLVAKDCDVGTVINTILPQGFHS